MSDDFERALKVQFAARELPADGQFVDLVSKRIRRERHIWLAAKIGVSVVGLALLILFSPQVLNGAAYIANAPALVFEPVIKFLVTPWGVVTASAAAATVIGAYAAVRAWA